MLDFLVDFFAVVSSVAAVSLEVDEPVADDPVADEPVAPCVFDSDDLPADLSVVEFGSLMLGLLVPVEPVRLVVAAVEAPLPDVAPCVFANGAGDAPRSVVELESLIDGAVPGV